METLHFNSYRKLKGYYPLYWGGMFYDTVAEIRAENEIDDIYSLCACKEDGSVMAVITYYQEDDTAGDKEITVDFGKPGARYEYYLLDCDHDGEKLGETETLSFVMKRNSCILIKEL